MNPEEEKAVLDPSGHIMDVLSPFISVLSVILIDSSTDSPVHVLMLSIQAVRGLPRLRAPDIVPCIIFLQATPLLGVIGTDFRWKGWIVGPRVKLVGDPSGVAIQVA